MQVLYSSADDVRLAAAVSLGFVHPDVAIAGSSGFADAPSRPVRDAGPAAAGAVPTMPDESAVRAAEDTLASISRSVIAEESEREG